MSDDHPSQAPPSPAPLPEASTTPTGKRPSAAPDGTNLANLLDGVRWDYDSARDGLSPLTTTERFFEDFPWEG